MTYQKNIISTLFITLLILITLLIASQPSWAHQDKAYIIGPRDVLNLKIFAGNEIQQDIDLTVSSQGMINAPCIGPVKAEGLTIPRLTALIIAPLAKDYFVNPEVYIYVKEYHSLQYYISGAVKNPGLYKMTSKASIMKLIAKAGGVLPERGNIAYVLRGSVGNISKENDIDNLLSRKEPIKINLKNLLDKGDISCNLILQTGDVVYIPLQKTFDLGESKIYVEGEVKNPGIYNYQPGLTVMNACIMAGGFAKFAAPNRARIIRKEGDKIVVIKIDLDDVKKGGIPDIELKPGDRIHIPETWL
jgi:polysaccharide export outer membrane protein